MYCNQTALWNKVVSPVDVYGDITPSLKRFIKVRRQEHVEEFIAKDGTRHKTNYVYYTYEDVRIDDTLDGHVVVDLYDMRTLQGKRKLRRLITV